MFRVPLVFFLAILVVASFFPSFSQFEGSTGSRNINSNGIFHVIRLSSLWELGKLLV